MTQPSPAPVARALEVLAPAKLNLFLHVVGRRPDGYHLLQSVFVPIDWCDALRIEVLEDGRLERVDEGPTASVAAAALPAHDLCLRAARALQAAGGTPLGARIRLDKRIPQGAGLGGGSSDAAAVLLALNELWSLHWSSQRLRELAVGLGADVPFFIEGRPAWVEGIGDRLTVLDGDLAFPAVLRDAAYVVIKPPQSVATAAIFSAPDLPRDTKPAILSDFLAAVQAASGSLLAGLASPTAAPGSRAGGTSGPFSWPAGSWRNDLQGAAQRLCPSIAQAAQWLDQRFGNSRMTGSGSAVFAVLTSEDDRRRAQALLSELPPDWEARVCRALRAHPRPQARG
jgi:4-diphosphocytidyl-2-C-methyl-D-erythritol kinase